MIVAASQHVFFGIKKRKVPKAFLVADKPLVIMFKNHIVEPGIGQIARIVLQVGAKQVSATIHQPKAENEQRD